ncbi:MAG: SDR family NAD(P)-dependent oxidoreductase [Sphingomonadales bacterium]|nr:SDR family NAD(P)-dependent oxidoreductase [Sphingomonadales bacterium]
MTDSDFQPFAGASALIFGGGQNIGRAIALEWARRGAKVAIADLNAEGAAVTAEEIRAAGGEAIGTGADVTSDDSVAAAVAAAEAAFGPLDILMNNAGILSGGNPQDIPVSAWQQMLDVNLLGQVRAINLVLPGMLERGRGHIANTASFAGMYPFACSRVHYAASKAAVLSYSENLALYCLPYGVRVSCLCPGPVMTTSVHGMKHFSESYEMRMPGDHLTLKSQEETAIVLSDGMRDGRIVIPTDELVWPTMRELAAGPDAFIAKKAAEFAAGNSGRPMVPAQFLKPA